MDRRSLAWPSAVPSYRLRPPAADGTAPLDAMAAVLDATEQRAERVSVRLAIGRRTDLLGPRRIALESLSGQEGVTVADDHTIGTVPLTGETFDTLVRLDEVLDRAVVWDTDGVPIAEWRDGRLRFALPADAVERLRGEIETALADRIERVE